MPSITKKMEPYNITGFSPYNMTNLDLWLDGNDPTTMFNASNGGANVTNGGFIFRWQDKSPKANHVYTMTGGSLSQPQYYANLTNNLGGLTFSNSVLTNLVQAPYPVDVYMVLSLCNYNNIGISAITNANLNVFSVKYPGGSFGSNKDWNSLAYGLINYPRGINYSQKWVNNSSNYSRTCNVVPSVQETSMGFIMINWGISNSDYYIKRYTTTLAETTSYTSWTTYANSNTSFRYYIGGIDYSATDSNFNGSICEILSFSNLLNVSNRTLVESYLANKWGLQANIPISHPGHLGNLPTTIGYSLTTSDGVHGYSNKAKGTLVYVKAPGPLTLSNFTTTINGGYGAQYSLNMGWTNPGGVVDYYTVAICNSTDNSTWQDLQYYPPQNRLTENTLTFSNSIIILDMYYNYTVGAYNMGGSNIVTSASYLNSAPGVPIIPVSGSPYKTTASNGTNDLGLIWSQSAGGTAISYNVTVYSNTSATKGPTFYTFSNIPASNILMNWKTSYDSVFYPLLTNANYSYQNRVYYGFQVEAVNGLGISQPTTAVFLYYQ
jgi:hypothetical protein